MPEQLSVSQTMRAEAWSLLWPVLEELGANEQFPTGTGVDAAIGFVRSLADEVERLRAAERQRDAYRTLLVFRRGFGLSRWFAYLPARPGGYAGGEWSLGDHGYYFESVAQALAAVDEAAGIAEIPTTEAPADGH